MAAPRSSLNIICLETEAFYALLDAVVARIKTGHAIAADPWVEDEEAMRLLRITSKTTLQKYRDERRIRFTQPSRKVILYDRESIFEYLDKRAENPLP